MFSFVDFWVFYGVYWNCCGFIEIIIVNIMFCYVVGEKFFIGILIFNNIVYIFNDQMEFVKVGVLGIMWVGGYGIL